MVMNGPAADRASDTVPPMDVAALLAKEPYPEGGTDWIGLGLFAITMLAFFALARVLGRRETMAAVGQRHAADSD